ncbi:hypothetical protein [Sulfurimonas sp.]|jgi:hypothetical protein|uniref:sacsin N-terminal ATP-binding-like domain-containing protein n=1 Tax=Sulfurimonas sp. TaxID=2022749 RepID=UPI0025D7467C|nr:hypothetical protein [Sulfurimonas sp.]MBT5934398.1 hypothetical protein [Sulfurimonas sp.]
MDIKDLYEKRKAYVDSARDNNFEEGLLNLLTKLYPDNAHFIYELLQNAEDTGATKILFELDKEQLIFSHNGLRAFSFKDVESITSIGNSTKTDDINSIGKFGVGFKAVFSYTKTPKIYSQDISFEILDLFIPKKIPSININQEYSTVMVFPFDHKDKTAKKAFEEVSNHLDNLSDVTLLFLSNINEIAWDIGNGISSLKRVDDVDNKIQIHNSKTLNTSYWLQYKKFLNGSSKLYVAIAYELRQNEEKDMFEIVPTDGTVSIFFPAEKETSKLKFHIHAPFASTVARDSIINLPENITLMRDIADLTSESLFDIRDKNMLNVDFLHVLPFPEDYLSNLYIPIQKKIYEVFQEEKLLPTELGDYASVEYCYNVPSDIKRVLAEEDLATLIQKDPNQIYFVRSPSMINSRAGKFLQSLKIEKWEWNELENSVRILNDEISRFGPEYIKSIWLESKDIEWVQKLYALLLDAMRKHDANFQDRNYDKTVYPLTSLIKLEDTFNFKQLDIYFLDHENRLDGIKYVNDLVYNTGTNKKQKEKAKQFLIEMGVKEITESEQLKILLEEQYTFTSYEEDFNFKQYINHLKRFLAYQIAGNDTSFIGNYKIILVKDGDRKKWVKPIEIFLDEPYEKTGISSLADTLNLYSLDDLYTTFQNDEDFIKFLKLLGAKHELKIDEVTIDNNLNFMMLTDGKSMNKLTSRAINIDYTIKDINQILKKATIEKSLLVWNTMCHSAPSALEASFRPHGKAPVKTTKSQLVQALINTKWIPSLNEEFCYPADISKDTLHPLFKYENKNGWLDVIEFGKTIEKEKAGYKEKEAIVQELGFESLDELDLLKQLKEQYSIDQLQNLISKKKATVKDEKKVQTLKEAITSKKSDGETKQFVESNDVGTIIKDEEKHQENIHQENKNSTNTITQVDRVVKKQDTEELHKIDTFLYEEYEGHCQICGDTFAHGNKNVSKNKSLNLGANRDINRKGNTISLCHKHWEIFNRDLVGHSYLGRLEDQESLSMQFIEGSFESYDWVTKEDINERDDAFYMLDDEDPFSRDNLYFLPIKIFGKTKYMKFTKTHIMAFIDVWNHN